MKNEHFKEGLRKSYIEGTGFLGPLYLMDELERARVFIQTMEDFISSSESAEVKELEAKITALSDEDKSEFWQWNYPIHWQDIFAVRIRSSFVLQICSHIEALLGDVAHRVQIIERCSISVQKIKGSTLEQHRLYLEEFGGFETPLSDVWEKMGFVFRIRNAHVHKQGHDWGISSDKKFAEFMSCNRQAATHRAGTETGSGCLIHDLSRSTVINNIH